MIEQNEHTLRRYHEDMQLLVPQRERRKITSAQVLALFGTPQDIIPAPGLNKAIIPEYFIVHKPAGTAYAGIAAGEDLVLRYTDASGLILIGVEATGFLDQATAQTRYAVMPQSAVGTVDVEITPVANAKVVLHMTVGEIITGDSPLYVTSIFRVIPTVFTFS